MAWVGITKGLALLPFCPLVELTVGCNNINIKIKFKNKVVTEVMSTDHTHKKVAVRSGDMFPVMKNVKH